MNSLLRQDVPRQVNLLNTQQNLSTDNYSHLSRNHNQFLSNTRHQPSNSQTQNRHSAKPLRDQNGIVGVHVSGNSTQSIIDLTVSQIPKISSAPLRPHYTQDIKENLSVVEPMAQSTGVSTSGTENITPTQSPHNAMDSVLGGPMKVHEPREPNNRGNKESQFMMPQGEPQQKATDRKNQSKPLDNNKLAQVNTDQHFLLIPHVQRKPPDSINSELPALTSGRQSV